VLSQSAIAVIRVVWARRAGKLVPGGAIRLDVQLHPANLREGKLQKVSLAGAHEVVLDRVAQKRNGASGAVCALPVAFCTWARAFSASSQEWKEHQKPVQSFARQRFDVVTASPAGKEIRAGREQPGAKLSDVGCSSAVRGAHEDADLCVRCRLERQRRGVASWPKRTAF